jgi:L-amino acid N-acyltransferase YncA
MTAHKKSKNADATALPVSDVAFRLRGKYFPAKLKNGVICEAVSKIEMNEFISKSFTKVFGNRPASAVAIPRDTKEWAGFESTCAEQRKLHHEFFLFKKNGKTIGWSYGEMEDFETFYMRNTGILPEHQSSGVYSEFLKCMLKYLKALGYQRVSGQHSGHNVGIFRAKMSLGFIIVGTENHDRWGHLVKMVKFLSPLREKKFRERF